jgi:hypothetical protein
MSEFVWPPSGASTSVIGPGSSTDNAVVRWDGAGGDSVQNSVVTVGDTGAIAGVTTINNTAIPSSKTLVVTTDKLSVLAATTSAELAGVISDGTGSGSLVFGTSPTLVTPALGAATATSINSTPIPSSKTLVVTTDTLAVLAATTSAELAGVISDETGSGSLVFATSPTLVTPALGTPASGVLTNTTGLPLTSGVTGTLPIANGGTGQTSQTAAYDALSPNTTKGDITAFNGTDNIRVAVGADGQVLAAASGQASGLQWTSPFTNPMTSANDVIVGGTGGAATRLPTSLLGDISASLASATITVTIATPGVVTHTSHGRITGEKVYFTTTGALPTGITASTTYYIIKIDANSYNIATTFANAIAGTKVATSGSQSGTHTGYVGGLVQTPGASRAILDGVAIGAGYVGEKAASSGSAGSASLTSTFSTPTSITVGPGIWEITLFVYIRSVGSITGVQVGISTDSAGTTFSDVAGFASPGNANVASIPMNTSIDGAIQLKKTVNVSASTTYYVKGKSTGASTDAGFYIEAYRIA